MSSMAYDTVHTEKWCVPLTTFKLCSALYTVSICDDCSQALVHTNGREINVLNDEFVQGGVHAECATDDTNHLVDQPFFEKILKRNCMS